MMLKFFCTKNPQICFIANVIFKKIQLKASQLTKMEINLCYLGHKS